MAINKLAHIKRRIRQSPPDYQYLMAGVARRYDLCMDKFKIMKTMQRTPLTDSWFRIIREFWFDRLLLSLLMIWGIIVLSQFTIPLLTKLVIPLMGFPFVFLVYELMARGETVFTVDKYYPNYAQRIANILDVPLVVFGHTHRPRLVPLSGGKYFVNTGTWAPLIDEQNRLMTGYRNYLMVIFEDGQHQFHLNSWPL
jgi:hypothetical protein